MTLLIDDKSKVVLDSGMISGFRHSTLSRLGWEDGYLRLSHAEKVSHHPVKYFYLFELHFFSISSLASNSDLPFGSATFGNIVVFALTLLEVSFIITTS